MTGRVLDLRPDCLDRPSQLDVGVVETIMLWPDDKDRKFRHALNLRHEIKMGELGGLPPEELEKVAQRLDELPRYTDVLKEVKKGKYDHGTAAGIILYSLVKNNFDGDLKLSLTEAKRRVQKNAFKSPKSTSSIERIWKDYLPVAHLWAAWIHRKFVNLSEPFPCRASSLGSFLATAEWYADWGTSIKLSQSPSGVILQAERLIRVPQGLILPAVTTAA
jgi:hypothetical protein